MRCSPTSDSSAVKFSKISILSGVRPCVACRSRAKFASRSNLFRILSRGCNGYGELFLALCAKTSAATNLF